MCKTLRRYCYCITLPLYGFDVEAFHVALTSGEASR